MLQVFCSSLKANYLFTLHDHVIHEITSQHHSIHSLLLYNHNFLHDFLGLFYKPKQDSLSMCNVK